MKQSEERTLYLSSVGFLADQTEWSHKNSKRASIGNISTGLPEFLTLTAATISVTSTAANPHCTVISLPMTFGFWLDSDKNRTVQELDLTRPPDGKKQQHKTYETQDVESDVAYKYNSKRTKMKLNLHYKVGGRTLDLFPSLVTWKRKTYRDTFSDRAPC